VAAGAAEKIGGKDFMGKILLILLLMILNVFASSAALAAGGKIRFGNLAVVPSMGVDEVHDDNIYYTKRNKESDWITHFRPGLMLDYTIEGRGKCKFGYRGDYAYYSANKDNDWKYHLLFLDLDYLSPGGLIVKIKNDLVNTEDPYGGLTDYKLGQQTERWEDDLRTAVGFKFSDRFKLLTYYNYYRQDFKNNQSGTTGLHSNTNPYYIGSTGIPYYTYGEDYDQDYYYNEAGLGFETKVTHKTWAFLRYHNGSQQFFTHRNGVTSSNDASYDWQRVNTGLGFDDGGRFAGELNLGYQWNNHQNSHDRNGLRYKDENDWIAATRLTFEQVEGRKFYFNATRQMYQLESGISGYFLTTSIGIGVEQRIKSKFFLRLYYAFEKNKYNYEDSLYSGSRKDNIHLVRLGLKYTIKEWLYAGVHYDYIKDHSSDSLGGYQRNRFGISLDFKPADYH